MSPDVPLAAYDAAFKARLATLPGRTRSAVAAACAERLYPAAVAWLRRVGGGGEVIVRSTLDLAWEGARTGGLTSDEARRGIEPCRALLADAGSAEVVPPVVEDAIRRRRVCARGRGGARRPGRRMGGPTGDGRSRRLPAGWRDRPGLADADRTVWEHPLVVAEVARREADLRRLEAADWAAALAGVRLDAAQTSALPLDRLGTDG